jgi:hypothetical protein
MSAAPASVSPDLFRHLFRCRNCGHAWRLDSDLHLISSQRWYELNNRPQDCPSCGEPVRGKLVVGKFNPAKVCNSKCMGATSGACECSCAGRNHGAAL